MTWKAGRNDIIFISIVVLVHLLFFLSACHYTRIFMGDSFEYIYEAINIKKDGWFYSGNPALPALPEYMTQRQPGYPLFLLSVYMFTINNWVVLVLQNILSVINIMYIRHTFGRRGYQKRYDWLLLLFVVGYPSQFINANNIAPEILLQTCTLFYLGNFIKLWQTGRPANALVMSLWLAGGLMVKPVLYPFAAVHLILLLVMALKNRADMKRLAAAALLPLAVVLLYNYSNYTRTGKFHFSSNQAFNAIYYFAAYFSQRNGAEAGQYFLRQERAATAEIPDYKTRYDYANRRGLTLLKENFVPYMGFHFKNAARILIEPGKAEIDLFTGRLTYGRLYSKADEGFYATVRKEGMVNGARLFLAANPSMPFILAILCINCIKIAGLALWLWSRRVAVQVRLFVFLLIGYFALAAGPIANTRYFLPVSLIAAVCAAMAVGYRNTPRPQK
ncbi:MAG: hypothetical protein H7257_02365 [Taibaiella sp.]|nr:hypothetical protein [Taibaiella sp.]